MTNLIPSFDSIRAHAIRGLRSINGLSYEEAIAYVDAAIAKHDAEVLAEKPDTTFTADCWTCAKLAADRARARGDLAGAISFRMYLCPECGSKRCPKAVDHRSECSYNQE